MPESRGPERSLSERLIDERALDWSKIPGHLLVQPPPPTPMPVRWVGPRHALTVQEVLATDERFDDFASHLAGTRFANTAY